MDYILKRGDTFTRFLDDGRVFLTNNAAERAVCRLQSRRERCRRDVRLDPNRAAPFSNDRQGRGYQEASILARSLEVDIETVTIVLFVEWVFIRHVHAHEAHEAWQQRDPNNRETMAVKHSSGVVFDRSERHSGTTHTVSRAK